MPDVVNQLLATEVALDKLGARGIAVAEAEQMIWNLHVIVRNRRSSPERRQPGTRRLVIGRSDANRVLTLVIEANDRADYLAPHYGVGFHLCRA